MAYEPRRQVTDGTPTGARDSHGPAVPGGSPPPAGHPVPAQDAPGGEAEAGLRQFAQLVVQELARPRIAGCFVPQSALERPQDMRRYTPEAQATRQGRLQRDDWWAIFRVQVFLFCLILEMSMQLYIDYYGPIFVGPNPPFSSPLAWLISLGLVCTVLTVVSYLDLRHLRRRLAEGLQQIDLLRRLYDGEDLVAELQAALWPPLRLVSRRKRYDTRPALIRHIANNLEWYVPPPRVNYRLEAVLQWTFWLLYIALLFGPLVVHNNFTHDTDSILMRPISIFLVSIIWMHFDGLRGYRRVVAREHWMLDIHDRHLPDAPVVDALDEPRPWWKI